MEPRVLAALGAFPALVGPSGGLATLAPGVRAVSIEELLASV